MLAYFSSLRVVRDHCRRPKAPGYLRTSLTFIIQVLLFMLLTGYFEGLVELVCGKDHEAGLGRDPRPFFLPGFVGEFQASFLIEVIWLIFYAAFGYANRFNSATFGSWSADHGFGQLVPILPLADPAPSLFSSILGELTSRSKEVLHLSQLSSLTFHSQVPRRLSIGLPASLKIAG